MDTEQLETLANEALKAPSQIYEQWVLNVYERALRIAVREKLDDASRDQFISYLSNDKGMQFTGNMYAESADAVAEAIQHLYGN